MHACGHHPGGYGPRAHLRLVINAGRREYTRGGMAARGTRVVCPGSLFSPLSPPSGWRSNTWPTVKRERGAPRGAHLRAAGGPLPDIKCVKCAERGRLGCPPTVKRVEETPRGMCTMVYPGGSPPRVCTVVYPGGRLPCVCTGVYTRCICLPVCTGVYTRCICPYASLGVYRVVYTSLYALPVWRSEG